MIDYSYEYQTTEPADMDVTFSQSQNLPSLPTVFEFKFSNTKYQHNFIKVVVPDCLLLQRGESDIKIKQGSSFEGSPSLFYTKEDQYTYVFQPISLIKITFWVTGLLNAYEGCEDPYFKLVSYADVQLRFKAAEDSTLQVQHPCTNLVCGSCKM